MKIQLMEISELNPAAYNPRVDLEPGMPEYEKLKASLKEFGFVDPPIFNQQTGNLVGGHQRVKVAKDLGYTQIHVSMVDMTIEKEKQWRSLIQTVVGHF